MTKKELVQLKKEVLKFNKIKEFIHPLLIKIMTSKTTGTLHVKGTFPSDEACLIVANHVCIEDIPTLGQAVKEHFYLLVSDEDKKTIDGLALMMNGVQWVHRLDKQSRINSSENAVKILSSGKSFAMYPEATWNLSPNQLIMPMNYGCIRIALEAGVPIVPVVSFFDKERRQTTIGEKFYPTEDLEKSIDELRDIMATMVYEHIQENYKYNYGKKGIYREETDGEIHYYERREDIDPFHWEKYISDRYDEYSRARNDKIGVREFESQFIFTPKIDAYSYFQLFNSVIKEQDGEIMIKRISSDKNGYNGLEYQGFDYSDHFGYGYNEKVLKMQLNHDNKN